MKAQVAEGRFREDLYYRLNVFPLSLPPLRSRKSDVIALSELFIRKYSEGKVVPQLSSEAKIALERYNWPGNVRELENVIQRALILSSGGVISGNDLCFESEGTTKIWRSHLLKWLNLG